MKQVDKFALECANRITGETQCSSRNALVQLGYESGFYKAIDLVIKYLESVDSGFRDEWFIDLKDIKNIADKELE